MNNIFKLLQILLLLLLSLNCVSQKYLRYNDDCCLTKPKKITITINNKQPNLNDKYESLFVQQLKMILDKNEVSVNLNENKEEYEKDNIFINFPYKILEKHDTIVGGGRNYRSYIEAPYGLIGLEAKISKKKESIYSMGVAINGDFRYLKDSGRYEVQKPEFLINKFAYFYANILLNLYSPPSSLVGKWLDLKNHTIYRISKDNQKYNAEILEESPSTANWIEYSAFNFELENINSSKNNFLKYKGTAKIGINQYLRGVNIIQFGNILLLKNPSISRKNILNQDVEFYEETYLLKIE